MASSPAKITLLAGGVGGAKLAEGLAALDKVDLSIICNIADDDEFHGLTVSPDVDTMTYTLAGLIDREQGWGVKNEGGRALEVLRTLGRDTWMTLGDRDLGLHIYRSHRLRKGDRPSDIAADIARQFGVGPKILLPTDDRVRSFVNTPGGWLSFQEYFVRQKCEPEVTELAYEGIDKALATPEATEAISAADLIIIAPSNPLVSIYPILKIAGIEAAIKAARAPIFALSPLIGGKVVKGPADKMMRSTGGRADVLGIASLYHEIADLLLIDDVDAKYCAELEALGIQAECGDILMRTLDDKKRIARQLLSFQEKTQKRAAS